jgi:vacuolar-type H+-ATPase subunit E/Vma4
MPAPAQLSAEALCSEILANARHECGEIIRQATTEIDDIRRHAEAEAEKIRRFSQEQARQESARRAELILATVAVEAGRLRAERLETLLESIRANIRRQLVKRDFDAHASLVNLAAEAIQQMAETNFTLKISAADRSAFGGKLADEIIQQTGNASLKLMISDEPEMTDGGVVVATADGWQIWDNRRLSRLERFWPELRRQIAVQTALVARNGIPEVPMQKGGA